MNTETKPPLLSDEQISEIYAKWNDTPGASYADLMRAAALAASQPAGEPVARVNDEGFIVETGLLLTPGMKLYASPPLSAPPEGWRMVPVEPTAEILRAIFCNERDSRAAWRDALAVAPDAPKEQKA